MADLMLGVTLQWTSIPSRWGVESTPGRFISQKLLKKSSCMIGNLSHIQILPPPLHAMLSVRFEVGVSLLLAPAEADKRGPNFL